MEKSSSKVAREQENIVHTQAKWKQRIESEMHVALEWEENWGFMKTTPKSQAQQLLESPTSGTNFRFLPVCIPENSGGADEIFKEKCRVYIFAICFCRLSV